MHHHEQACCSAVFVLSCGWSRHAHCEHGLAFCLRERVECPVTCANTPASCYGSIARKQVSHGVGPGRSQCGQREQAVLPVPELSELASAGCRGLVLHILYQQR